MFGSFLAFERSRRKKARSCSGPVVTHIFQKPLDNGYHRICVVSINTLGLGLGVAPPVALIPNAVGDRSRWVRVVERIGDDPERCVGKVGCNIIPPS